MFSKMSSLKQIPIKLYGRKGLFVPIPNLYPSVNKVPELIGTRTFLAPISAPFPTVTLYIAETSNHDINKPLYVSVAIKFHAA